MQLGMIGRGRMGGNIVIRLAKAGHDMGRLQHHQYDGRIEMDTNTVERAIRPITLNRKMPWQIPPDPPQL
jgi:6-phosphogluconate dehydrogenase (decarboxylating)